MPDEKTWEKELAQLQEKESEGKRSWPSFRKKSRKL
jgi:hypothetical protein